MFLVLTENDIVNVILNRPDKHNALNMDLFKQLTATAMELRDDKSVRAVILSGAGPSFCSGLDVKVSGVHEKSDEAMMIRRVSRGAERRGAK